MVGALFSMRVANLEKWAGRGTSVGHTQQEGKDGAQARGGEVGSRIRTEMIDITDELDRRA